MCFVPAFRFHKVFSLLTECACFAIYPEVKKSCSLEELILFFIFYFFKFFFIGPVCYYDSRRCFDILITYIWIYLFTFPPVKCKSINIIINLLSEPKNGPFQDVWNPLSSPQSTYGLNYFCHWISRSLSKFFIMQCILAKWKKIKNSSVQYIPNSSC